VIEALVAALQAEGGALAEQVVVPNDHRPSASGPAQIAASGPRAAAHRADYELLLEMIYEGSLLHYGSARVVRTDDPDLALLLGDQLYALGLARLAALGDLEAVDVLADVISALAQAHAEGAPERAPAIWRKGALAIGWGPTDGALTAATRNSTS
jgi:hypothetical protein